MNISQPESQINIMKKVSWNMVHNFLTINMNILLWFAQNLLYMLWNLFVVLPLHIHQNLLPIIWKRPRNSASDLYNIILILIIIMITQVQQQWNTTHPGRTLRTGMGSYFWTSLFGPMGFCTESAEYWRTQTSCKTQEETQCKRSPT